MTEITPGAFFTACTALLTVITGALVTTALNSRSQSRNKLWDLRRLSYSTILTSITSAEWIIDSADEMIREDASRYFHDDVFSRHSEMIGDHIRVARKEYTENYLILSDHFIELFEKFLQKIDDDDPNTMVDEAHQQFAEAVRDVRPRLLAQARREMAGRWLRPAWSRAR